VPIDARQIRTSCACDAPPMVLAGGLVCGACRAPLVVARTTPAPFSQLSLPPGTGRRKFLAVARALRAARDPGARKEGRTVLVDATAWPRGLALLGQGEAQRAVAIDPTPAAAGDVLAELGLAHVSGRGAA